jgi:Uma2 family endonuclease
MVVGTQYITAEEFERFIMLPENADKRFELIGGEIVEVVSNSYSSECAANILILLGGFVKTHKLGRVTGADGGYIVSGGQYIPDVAFISFDRQSEPSHEPYNPNPPDLAIEVLSPTDNPHKFRIKLSNYLAAGVVVWVVDPERQMVEIHQPGQPVQIVDQEGTLDGGHVLPGFTPPVRDIFPAEQDNA